MPQDLRKPYKPRCPKGARLIQLTQGQWTIVDEDRYDELNQWKWCALWHSKAQCYYAGRQERITDDHSKRRQWTIRMHRQIMEVTDAKIQVDHIRHRTLDNRVSQLKVVTNRQNQRNLEETGSSKYSNVCWHKASNKWMVNLMVCGVHVHMGLFINEDEAGAVAKIAQDYVDANPRCTAQDLKDLRTKLKRSN